MTALLLGAISAFCVGAVVVVRFVHRFFQVRKRYFALIKASIRDQNTILILARLVPPSTQSQIGQLHDVRDITRRALAALEELREIEGIA